MPDISSPPLPAATSGATDRHAASLLAQVALRPAQTGHTAPCSARCSTGADVRGWISVIAQRRKLGLTDSEALTQAWRMLTAVNPFPATLGRICPHPCESGCNRASKDGAVAINALERYLGDWGIRQHLGLPTLEERRQPEPIGVIGAGPAGLSFAYQMARRGYDVTVYEKKDKPGGMLYHGIPRFRLPEEVVAAEVRRVLDLGVRFRLSTAVGRDVSLHELRQRHAALFVGIGAASCVPLDVPGYDGAGVWAGIEYLGALNRGESAALGERVVVVGGGNTAMDAARCARRAGAQVTLIYRRTPSEMPAIRSEACDAEAEGVHMQYLAAPVRIGRSGDIVRAVIAQRMQLGEADASGRRRCVPVAGSEFELPADSVIAAVSRHADWSGFDKIDLRDSPTHAQGARRLAAGVWVGGDALGPDIAGLAIAEGRLAAEAVHADLRGLSRPARTALEPVACQSPIRMDHYPAQQRACEPPLGVSARLANPGAEVERTLDTDAFLDEVMRCFSCSLCFGCELCFMYCTAGAFSRLDPVAPGSYFALRLDSCEGCGECIELCPCGFLSAVTMAAGP
jgi:NADPH-dependent glutamate synthase beta subunit-like oxidoreductase/Pyruvate/2-oxoacid:ferredoxin oxidoreductase delta subunit